ncbi:MAG: cupin domain-containing protein [Candidatus Marinimicrobia bacterium]|jgi:quercetin dioxygenase-like cupin family protein|nr:cupin domain-containing protein [Candidatus Neomarinimicrobiota bacterium]MDP6594265.1 cupin domain-containing protein [Candidatus Neomarinimicrobiota bacterium]MDP6836696.1 cupin domain-containing protein [Candidatus Neomarinimicrobiota bacterium]MDP6967407.1 cupin domain-containing protein [Candidatus Neomarinimicrobiota bacterium]|tara:strand:+ start:218 stop:544 length:327 start_codon:yes stop_codon:yes gene_type:complete
MNYCDKEARERKELAPGVSAKTFWGDRMLMAHVLLAPGSEVPLHSHPQEQCGIVLKGEIVFDINGEVRSLKEDDSYLIPSGVEHGARTGAVSAEVLDVFSPVREDLKY